MIFDLVYYLCDWPRGSWKRWLAALTIFSSLLLLLYLGFSAAGL